MAGDSAGGKGPPVWAKAVPDRGPERLPGPVRLEGKKQQRSKEQEANQFTRKNKTLKTLKK